MGVLQLSARAREINETPQSKTGSLSKHPWHIFTFTESTCKHSCPLLCSSSSVSGALSLHYSSHLASTTSFSHSLELHDHITIKAWHTKITHSQYELLFPDIMWVDPFCTSWVHTNGESGSCGFLPLAQWEKQTPLLTTTPSPHHQVPRSLHGLVTSGLLPARGLNGP